MPCRVEGKITIIFVHGLEELYLFVFLRDSFFSLDLLSLIYG